MNELLQWAKTPLTIVGGLPITPALVAVVVLVALLVFKRR